MNLPAGDAIAATGARVVHAERLPGAFFVSTDTRTLQPGDAFVALRGERFDGHDYLSQALARGAGALVVSDVGRLPPESAALVVPDTTLAYLALGALARRTSVARVAALTGSAGKTTTKAFLTQILETVAPGCVASTTANENNEIGVAKSLLAFSPQTRYGVVEIGARRFGEIAPLARAAAADVAAITNVGDAHLEIMGSFERLLETKWGIFAAAGHRVLPLDDLVLEKRSRADVPFEATWFAVRDDAAAALAAPVERAVVVAGRTMIWYRDGETTLAYETGMTLPGDHNLANAAAAAAAAWALGIAPDAVARALRGLVLPEGRYERIALGESAAIYDAYNASTSGMLAALAAFAREAACRRIAVLGSMAELGPLARDMHERVGDAAAGAGLDFLLVGGDFAADLRRGASAAGFAEERIVPFRDNTAALSWLRANLRPGDLVLLKASRKYRLEEIVAGLAGAHAR